MKDNKAHTVLTYIIAIVWITNGVICKILNLVPRHQDIVSRILGDSYSESLTIAIGVSEIFMAIWVLSRYKTKLNTITQIIIVAVMNSLELFFAQDLLLWGKFNSLFAVIFIFIVYYNEFILNKNTL
ncbi:hypothetical protein A8C32_15750 [Flavivirga aquatica]|uniref:DoxX family protein n=1 Tax=Flavivirga aquatica TaxID=1849968 RepID=A0A1E5T9B1_9FLAO|nr:DoxX-like family protein [Flavivirga aquatica]OEK07928.1 hypothetical protein A8C32_15750 [Flavivirga aquatica]